MTREIHIGSYFSQPTDLAGAMRQWPEFASGGGILWNWWGLARREQSNVGEVQGPAAIPGVCQVEILPMNPKMVERTPHPGPLPIGSANSADAEREKRSQRLDEIMRRMVQGFNARMVRGNRSVSAGPLIDRVLGPVIYAHPGTVTIWWSNDLNKLRRRIGRRILVLGKFAPIREIRGSTLCC